MKRVYLGIQEFHFKIKIDLQHLRTFGLCAPYNYYLLLFQNSTTNVIHYLQVAWSEHKKCLQLFCYSETSFSYISLQFLITNMSSIRKRECPTFIIHTGSKFHHPWPKNLKYHLLQIIAVLNRPSRQWIPAQLPFLPNIHSINSCSKKPLHYFQLLYNKSLTPAEQYLFYCALDSHTPRVPIFVFVITIRYLITVTETEHVQLKWVIMISRL